MLSQGQQKILDYKEGTVVVKACPGSGKTYSVAARISDLLNTQRTCSICAVSFTNVACDEIIEKLKNEFGVIAITGHPHFIGTLDRFINSYIFLPYGHLIMKCKKRPELVGEPYNHWTKGKGDKQYRYIPGGEKICSDANPDGYFDCVTFDIQDEVIPIVPEREIHFSLKKEKYYKVDGLPKKNIQDLSDSKWANFKLGYANQADASYLALKVLEKYPLIARNVAAQFKYFIVDEAQDTDEIRMKILDILHANGAKNIMLIGDRDQAIFEWNNASPEIFDQKYIDWDKIELNENRRSSQNVCNFIRHLSSFPRIQAIDSSIFNYDFIPQIHSIQWPSNKRGNVISFVKSKSQFDKIVTHFCATCEQHKIMIDKKRVAILYRGRDYSKYLGITQDLYDFDYSPWHKGNYHVKDIVRGKFLLEKGDFAKGYKLLEKGFFEAIHKMIDANFVSSELFIKDRIDKMGLINHRDEVFKFVNSLPSVGNIYLDDWVAASNEKLRVAGYPFRLKVDFQNAHVITDQLFGSVLVKQDNLPFYHGTIHSAKGKTFEAVLLLLGKRPGSKSNYATMLKTGPKPGEEEEFRNVYVAISRPRKILMLATPSEDVPLWVKKFKM